MFINGDQTAQVVIKKDKYRHTSLDLECYLSLPFLGTSVTSLSAQNFICLIQNEHK